jgi:hypothetical protein
MPHKRSDKVKKRAEGVRIRQVAHESMTPREIVRGLRDRGITSGREWARLVWLLNDGWGDVPLGRIRAREARIARDNANRRAEDRAAYAHVMSYGGY